jgi:N-acetylmuramoyl-L-alanine amidase
MRSLQRVLSVLGLGLGAGCAPLPPAAPTPVPAPARPASAPAASPARAQPSSPAHDPSLPPPLLSNSRWLPDGRTLSIATPGSLPPIPAVDGALDIKVVYPRERQLISVNDSTFLLGSVGSGLAALTINGASVPVNPNGSFLAWLPVPNNDPPAYHLVATKNGTKAEMTRRISRPRTPATPVEPPPLVVHDAPKLVELLNANVDAKSDSDSVAIIRPSIGGTYKWFLFPGTVVEETARRGAWSRLRFDDLQEAWVETTFVKGSERVSRPQGFAPGVIVSPGAGSSDVRIPLGQKVPFLVEHTADAIVLTLYSTRSEAAALTPTPDDPSIAEISADSMSPGRVQVTIHLRHQPVGYQVLWETGTFVLRVRHLPRVNAARPLSGLRIAVDPGHPPIGSTGPTGLYEAEATLAVGFRLAALLEQAGAIVVLTRNTSAPVALGDRPIQARRANVDAFVSIHLNALPDGVNPLRSLGSGTYFFHGQSEPLARVVQRGLVRWMGLRDQGVFLDNLAVARPTWFPSVLAEGAFVILPDQEAALRTEEFQTRYALGILEGLESYFRSLAK